MSVEKHNRIALLSWVFVGVIVGLCAILGVIQYRWIGELTAANHDRLRDILQRDLRQVSEDFDAAVRSTYLPFSRRLREIDESERERDYAIRYSRWRMSSRYSGLVRRLAIAVRGQDSLELHSLDFDKGTFGPAEWPSNWSALRERLTARAFGDPSARRKSFEAPSPAELALIYMPEFGFRDHGDGPHPNRDGPGPPKPDESPDRFGPPREFVFGGASGRVGENGWTILELDLDYIRNSLLPELLERRLGGGHHLDYQVQVALRDHPSVVIYDSDPDHHSEAALHADASIGLFEAPFDQMIRTGVGLPPGPQRAAGGLERDPQRGRWLLSARHRSGSLEALVEQGRRRNLAVMAGILLLMLAAAGALLQFTRSAQRLAQLQMEFVAGVSHELRTPLSVIRTAAHNLGVRVISNASQVQRYGSLIEEQSEKLTDLIDRVLLFSNAKAGRVIHSREVVGVTDLVEDAEEACAKAIQESRCIVETVIQPDIPQIFGDPTALKHALLNLINNAAKYASEGGRIGISASAVTDRKGAMVEIRVSDRGPGIPARELTHIFDPFYRGKMAIDDQIHGTGLGLSMVERIIKAHRGTVAVKSELGIGTEFVVRIPAAPVEEIDEFADSASRR